MTEIFDVIDKIEGEYDADIFAYIAPIFGPLDDKVLHLCRNNKRHKNILLMIDTPGGSADAAYRIIRAIHRCYHVDGGQLIFFVPRFCKSAGTIMALGGDRLIMSQEAELGPIDVQLRTDDEVGERTSGLTPHQALDTLAGEAVLHFRRFFRHLRYDDDTLFSTRLSAELASQMAIGLMSPIYEQLDPLRLGEVERFVRIAVDYGERISSSNVKHLAIEKLAAAYPSHGFVIDREEAEDQLFHKVEKPTDALEMLARAVIDNFNPNEPVVRFLRRPEQNPQGDSDETDEPNKRKSRSRKRGSSAKVRSNSSEPNGVSALVDPE